MQRNLTTDTVCQNLLLQSVTSELTLKKKNSGGKRFRLACNAKKQGKGGGWGTGRCGKTSN